jgi:hypothetical protein
MTLPETFDHLHDAGFQVTVNEAHTEVTVSLSRKVHTMEVWAALGYAFYDLVDMPKTEYSRLKQNGDVVVITE